MSLSRGEPPAKRALTDDEYNYSAFAKEIFFEFRTSKGALRKAGGKQICIMPAYVPPPFNGHPITDAVLARAIGSGHESGHSYYVSRVTIDLPISGHLDATLHVIRDRHARYLTDVTINVPCDTRLLADLLNGTCLGTNIDREPLSYKGHSLTLLMPHAEGADPRTVFDGQFWNRLQLPGLRFLAATKGSAKPPIQEFTAFLARHPSLHQFEISEGWGADAAVVHAIWRHLDNLNIDDVRFPRAGGKYAYNAEPLAGSRVLYLRAVAGHLGRSALGGFWDRYMSPGEKERVVDATRTVGQSLAVDAVEGRFYKNRRADTNLLPRIYGYAGGWPEEMANEVWDRARKYPDEQEPGM